ncbi:iron uptake transporter deferrochelatase/peroxidase subunit [Providencia vermicola]|uniref:Deferrochelatase n=1 Tax=Providencia vermicola TaxID=333965 RepID=A0AAX3RYP8_9GAMM|nr:MULTISPECIES: iron uptake transporter deferrochelatase/peroxidase subunit [Providencia]ELX8379484.1 deferrochelatase/peroxidase EfeB [Providencia stuartii]ELX8381467.1 deferrochelatase/peroxidase EfeB [Providencia stuartii]EMD5258688.1 deferrochelatase/peroxidase EfeB [Providencia stuartii]MBG5919354.1 deferrochelatase/peroxidase EfeB [Providencia stuartii]USB35257.1 iron uptake transporter deferrochelatase/peroxidase subunit [Providencia vermicola]
MKAKSHNHATSISFSRRNALKTLAVGSFMAAAPTLAANTRQNQCQSSYEKTIPFEGLHQAGVLTPEQKNASFIAFNVTADSLDKLQKLFEILTNRIAYLTQVQKAPNTHNDRMPPAESGILGSNLQPDSLTVTVSLGHSLFDARFGLDKIKPRYLVEMTSFPNDRLEQQWCGGDISLQICANSQESVIYALRDLLRHTAPLMFPIWKIDGFLPSRDIDNHSTPINLFGFKDGTGNAPTSDSQLMNELIWVTEDNKEPKWCVGGTYQAVRLIRFNLEFWDRTPLEDQENDFGRHKDSGAPIGMKQEHDDPEFAKDPHGDRILFDSHMRRAEPRNPERYTAKLRRRSYSYSLGLTTNGLLDMGLIFVSYQKNLKTGFIDTQKRLNGEPLERYIKPFGGGYYFVVPGIQNTSEYLAQGMFEALKQPR